MAAGHRALAYWVLAFSSGCGASGEEPRCGGAISRQLALVHDTAASLHQLAAELSTTLFSSCLALSPVSVASESTALNDVDTLVAVCGSAAQTLAELRARGTAVAGAAAQCSVPAPDEACLGQCSNDAPCASLCESIATSQVECSGAEISVRADQKVDYQALLPPVLLSYARSRIASDASSSYVDVALPLLTSHEECVGPLEPEHWDDVILLQAVLVMSSDIAEQVEGFPL